jgi:hypothetical protein
VAPTRKKQGVLMVMMESYEAKTKSFLPMGQIAVAIKDTLESEEITSNFFNIGYLLFHTRKDEGKHLFIVDNIRIVDVDDVESGVYKTMKSGKVIKYAVVTFNSEFELFSEALHPQMKPSVDRSTRYDAQYATLKELY